MLRTLLMLRAQDLSRSARGRRYLDASSPRSATFMPLRNTDNVPKSHNSIATQIGGCSPAYIVLKCFANSSRERLKVSSRRSSHVWCSLWAVRGLTFLEKPP